MNKIGIPTGTINHFNGVNINPKYHHAQERVRIIYIVLKIDFMKYSVVVGGWPKLCATGQSVNTWQIFTFYFSWMSFLSIFRILLKWWGKGSSEELWGHFNRRRRSDDLFCLGHRESFYLTVFSATCLLQIILIIMNIQNFHDWDLIYLISS